MSQMQVEKPIEAARGGEGARTHEDLNLAHSVIRERHNSLPEDLRLAIRRVDGIVAGGFVRDALARKMSTAAINTSGGGLDIFLRQNVSLPELCDLLPGHQFSYVSKWIGWGRRGTGPLDWDQPPVQSSCSGYLVSTCAHPHIVVQFIMPVPGIIISSSDILGSFDFTMNQVGYEIDASGFQYYLGWPPDTLGGLSAIVRGELVANGPIPHTGRMRARVRRFIARGWEPDEYVQGWMA